MSDLADTITSFFSFGRKEQNVAAGGNASAKKPKKKNNTKKKSKKPAAGASSDAGAIDSTAFTIDIGGGDGDDEDDSTMMSDEEDMADLAAMRADELSGHEHNLHPLQSSSVDMMDRTGGGADAMNALMRSITQQSGVPDWVVRQCVDMMFEHGLRYDDPAEVLIQLKTFDPEAYAHSAATVAASSNKRVTHARGATKSRTVPASSSSFAPSSALSAGTAAAPMASSISSSLAGSAASRAAAPAVKVQKISTPENPMTIAEANAFYQQQQQLQQQQLQQQQEQAQMLMQKVHSSSNNSASGNGTNSSSSSSIGSGGNGVGVIGQRPVGRPAGDSSSGAAQYGQIGSGKVTVPPISTQPLPHSPPPGQHQAAPSSIVERLNFVASHSATNMHDSLFALCSWAAETARMSPLSVASAVAAGAGVTSGEAGEGMGSARSPKSNGSTSSYAVVSQFFQSNALEILLRTIFTNPALIAATSTTTTAAQQENEIRKMFISLLQFVLPIPPEIAVPPTSTTTAVHGSRSAQGHKGGRHTKTHTSSVVVSTSTTTSSVGGFASVEQIMASLDALLVQVGATQSMPLFQQQQQQQQQQSQHAGSAALLAGYVASRIARIVQDATTEVALTPSSDPASSATTEKDASSPSSSSHSSSSSLLSSEANAVFNEELKAMEDRIAALRVDVISPPAAATEVERGSAETGERIQSLFQIRELQMDKLQLCVQSLEAINYGGKDKDSGSKPIKQNNSKTGKTISSSTTTAAAASSALPPVSPRLTPAEERRELETLETLILQQSNLSAEPLERKRMHLRNFSSYMDRYCYERDSKAADVSSQMGLLQSRRMEMLSHRAMLTEQLQRCDEQLSSLDVELAALNTIQEGLQAEYTQKIDPLASSSDSVREAVLAHEQVKTLLQNVQSFERSVQKALLHPSYPSSSAAEVGTRGSTRNVTVVSSTAKGMQMVQTVQSTDRALPVSAASSSSSASAATGKNGKAAAAEASHSKDYLLFDRIHLLNGAVASYIANEAECIRFLAARAMKSKEKLAQLQKELSVYQSMGMKSAVPETEKNVSRISLEHQEDLQAVLHLRQDVSHLLSKATALFPERSSGVTIPQALLVDILRSCRDIGLPPASDLEALLSAQSTKQLHDKAATIPSAPASAVPIASSATSAPASASASAPAEVAERVGVAGGAKPKDKVPASPARGSAPAAVPAGAGGLSGRAAQNLPASASKRDRINASSAVAASSSISCSSSNKRAGGEKGTAALGAIPSKPPRGSSSTHTISATTTTTTTTNTTTAVRERARENASAKANTVNTTDAINMIEKLRAANGLVSGGVTGYTPPRSAVGNKSPALPVSGAAVPAANPWAKRANKAGDPDAASALPASSISSTFADIQREQAEELKRQKEAAAAAGKFTKKSRASASDKTPLSPIPTAAAPIPVPPPTSTPPTSESGSGSGSISADAPKASVNEAEGVDGVVDSHDKEPVEKEEGEDETASSENKESSTPCKGDAPSPTLLETAPVAPSTTAAEEEQGEEEEAESEGEDEKVMGEKTPSFPAADASDPVAEPSALSVKEEPEGKNGEEEEESEEGDAAAPAPAPEPALSRTLIPAAEPVAVADEEAEEEKEEKEEVGKSNEKNEKEAVDEEEIELNVSVVSEDEARVVGGKRVGEREEFISEVAQAGAAVEEAKAENLSMEAQAQAQIAKTAEVADSAATITDVVVGKGAAAAAADY